MGVAKVQVFQASKYYAIEMPIRQDCTAFWHVGLGAFWGDLWQSPAQL
jgi:hypothetical protein